MADSETDSAELPDPAAPPQPPTVLFGGDQSAAGLVRLLDEYLADLQAGRAPDRKAFIAAHPEWARQLEECLSGIEFMHRAGSASDAMPAKLGDFRIVREVGRGGMGVVYEAEQLSLKRKVALKVLRFGAVADAEAMQRFQREAETVAGLHHTNIVPIFAIGGEQGIRYYAMQFIEGQSLAQVAAEENCTGKRARPRDVAGWGLQAAEALAHAHARGVVHRDVKPSNLILDADGRIWLTDFGLAKRDDDVTLSLAGALLGTPRYMSPEQASALRKPVDHRTDIYSLGATLYELATGRPIFDADTPHGVITQILSQDPPAPRVVAPELPQDFETIILKCLAKEPERRYASAAALAADLRAFLEDRPIAARRATLIEQAIRYVQKHRRTAGVASISAAAALLVAIGTYLGWQSYRESRNGELQLTSEGGRLVAEILDERDNPVLAPISVPTQQNVKLPEGIYRVRISSSGLLSETWPLDIERGKSQAYSLRLPPRWLWSPQETHPLHLPYLFSLDGPADIVIADIGSTEEQGWRRNRLRRIDGATGQAVWPADFVFDPNKPPDGIPGYVWAALPSFSGNIPQYRGVVEQTPDLDGDGTGDLVVQSCTVPLLAAVSGKTGTLLWAFRARPPGAPPETNPQTGWSIGPDFGIGQAAVAQIDGDGVPDFLACFNGRDPNADSGQRGWVSAISGKTGGLLWSHDLGTGQLSVSGGGSTRAFLSPCRPLVVDAPGGTAIVLVAEKRLVALDPASGNDLWPTIDLGVRPIGPPQVVDSDGDGRDDLLVCAALVDRETLSLHAFSIDRRERAWGHRFRPVGSADNLEYNGEIPFVIADLDGDRRPEILLASVSDEQWMYERSAVVSAINAADGSFRWERTLSPRGSAGPPISIRLIVGPDLNGDRSREVFVASHEARSAVDALSGADGRRLWHKALEASGRSTTPDPSGPLAWWNAGSDGWPTLLVPVVHGPGDQPTTWFLSAADGHVAHTLPEVFAPKVADVNGDGLVDLFYTIAPQGAPRMMVLAGSTPEPWKRLGLWRPIGDVDGDGTADFLADDRSAAAAGDDARILWHAASPHSGNRQSNLEAAAPLPWGDLDGDGAPDPVGPEGSVKIEGYSRSSFATLAAISGKDGHRLWLAPDFGLSGGAGGGAMGWSYDYPMLDWADLDGDRHAEFLVAHGSYGVASMALSALSGRDGSLLWQTPISYGSFGSKPDLYGRPKHDLDGDGFVDFVFWTPRGKAVGFNSPCQLQAISGRDGQPLWSDPMTGDQADVGLLWPVPAVGDLDRDGAPEAAAVWHSGYDPQRGHAGELTVLDARTGHHRWNWSWHGNSDILPPLLVDFEGQGRKTLCLGISPDWSKPGPHEVLCFDPAGSIRQRVPITISSGALANLIPLWRVFDVDGDGRDELLLSQEGRLIAWRLEGAPVWSWPLPHPQAEIVALLPKETPFDASPTLAVWAGKMVYGLAGSDGRVVWKCPVPTEPGRGGSHAPIIDLLPGRTASTAPQVLLHAGYDQQWATVVRQPWPVGESEKFAPPTPPPLSIEPLPEERPRGIKLPWTVSDPSPYRLGWGLTSIAVPSGLVTLVLIVIPAWLALRARRRQSWALGVLLVAYTAIGLFGPYEQAVSSAVAMLLPLLLLVDAVRTRSRKPAVMAAVLFILLLLTVVWFHLAAKHSLAEVHPWRGWWWLDELLGERFLLAAVCAPGLVFWWRLIGNLREHRFVRAGWLLVAATAAAIVAAALTVSIDSLSLPAGQRYEFTGWYFVWFWGVYVVGVILTLVMLVNAVRNWRARVRVERASARSSTSIRVD